MYCARSPGPTVITYSAVAVIGACEKGHGYCRHCGSLSSSCCLSSSLQLLSLLWPVLCIVVSVVVGPSSSSSTRAAYPGALSAGGLWLVVGGWVLGGWGLLAAGCWLLAAGSCFVPRASRLRPVCVPPASRLRPGCVPLAWVGGGWVGVGTKQLHSCCKKIRTQCAFDISDMPTRLMRISRFSLFAMSLAVWGFDVVGTPEPKTTQVITEHLMKVFVLHPACYGS
jgi:hypothetical protein